MSRSAHRPKPRLSCGCCHYQWLPTGRPRLGSTFALAEAAEELDQANWWGDEWVDDIDWVTANVCQDEEVDRRNCFCWRGGPDVSGWRPTLAALLAA